MTEDEYFDDDYDDDFENESMMFLKINENGVGELIEAKREITIIIDFDLTDDEFEELNKEVYSALGEIFKKYKK